MAAAFASSGALILAVADVASAAGFTSAPPAYANSEGPFAYGVASSQARNGMYGWVAYRLPGETSWTRCSQALGRQTRALQEGSYLAEVADDFNVDNLIERGIYGGQCAGSEPSPGFVRTQRPLIVDLTPPVVDEPTARADERSVILTVPAQDTLAGIADVTFSFGDGATAAAVSGAAGYVAGHTYAIDGTFPVAITASDRAGNRTTRTLAVTVERRAPPLGPALLPPPAPGPQLPSPTTTSLSTLSERQARAAAARHLRSRYESFRRGVKLGHSFRRLNRTSARCVLRWRYRHRSYRATVDLNRVQTGLEVRSRVKRIPQP